jgi:hypothetical protein
MINQVVIGSAFVAKYPKGGGNFWVPLQYLRGFRDLGVDALWLEVVESTGDDAVDREFIDTFLERARELHIDSCTALAFYPTGVAHPDHRVIYGLSACEVDARCRDAVLLNMVGSLNPALRAPFARTILFDLDPGFFQIWAAQWRMGVGEHDVHLTIGQHLGAGDSPIPLGGVDWKRTWPAVHLPSWQRMAVPGDAYTTVTQWWSLESAWMGDELFDYSKRNSFVQFLELPRRTGAPLELAANIHPAEQEEREQFTRRGWRIVPPEVVASTPERFRTYVQRSRGEFACAKPGYVKGRTGWLSDRSVCYLASGRPCVLQDTGLSPHLPDSLGLRTFTTLDDAAAAIEAVERDYARASDAARQLAEELFSTSVVLPKILAMAGTS